MAQSRSTKVADYRLKGKGTIIYAKGNTKAGSYIAINMTDLMRARQMNTNSIHLGTVRQCHKQKRLFDLIQGRTCSELFVCPEIAKFTRCSRWSSAAFSWCRMAWLLPCSIFSTVIFSAFELDSEDHGLLGHHPHLEEGPYWHRK